MDTLAQDLRYCARAFRRAPGFVAVTVLSLGLATGATIAVFGFVDALWLRPLSVPRAGELVTLEQVEPAGSRFYNLSLNDRDRLAVPGGPFTGVAGVTWADGFDPAAHDTSRVSLVTGNYFAVLELHPRLGRLIAEADDAADGQAVAVISEQYWRRRYAAAPDIVGRALIVNGASYVIVGIGPSGFSGDWIGWPTDIWIPASMASRVLAMPGGPAVRTKLQYKLMARRRPGVTNLQAQAAAEIVYRQLQADPPPMSGVVSKARLQLVPAATGYSRQRQDFVQPLGILMAVVAVVLLIACANTANLLLARAAFRHREIAVRLAIGAARGRIIRLLLTESAALAVMGAALGLLLAGWGSDILLAIVRSAPVVPVTNGIPTADLNVAPDARIVLFTLALSVLTTILIGLTPALRGSHARIATALARRSDAAAGARAGGPRMALVIAQIAASLALLTGTGLMARTLHNLKAQDLGFSRDRLLLAWTLPGQAGHQGVEAAAMWQAAQARVSDLPGVASASASVEGLLTGGATSGPRLYAEGSPGTVVRAQATMTVAPRFFETVGQPLLHGREFTWQDADGMPAVAIVNSTLARLVFGRVDVVGQRARIAGSELPPIEIVGVVKDARSTSPRTAPAVIYYPAGQNLRRLARAMCLVVSIDGSQVAVAAQLRAALQEMDRNLPVVRVDSVGEQLASVLFEERLLTGLSIFLAGLALIMTSVGLYGVVAFTTARRTNELGIRLALGATPDSVMRMVVRETSGAAVAGIAAGLPLTIWSVRWLSSRLFGVTAADPLTIGAATLFMFAVVLAAAFVPARRASRIEPIAALRTE